MFRLAIAALAIVGLVSLFAGGVSAAAWGFGLLLIPLFFLVKIALVLFLFGAAGRMFSGRKDWGGWDRRWSGPRRRRRPQVEEPSAEERFAEWHRMSHAREEVDSWVPDVPTDENG